MEILKGIPDTPPNTTSTDSGILDFGLLSRSVAQGKPISQWHEVSLL